MKKKVIFFIFIITLALSTSHVVFGQSVTSNCVLTKIGSVASDPVLPPGCSNGIDGIEIPPSLIAHPSIAGYFKMPPSTDDSYRIYACENRTWGSQELIGVLHTVAKNWRQKYPQGFLYIGDLNATGHASHNIGIANDLSASTNGSDCVANYDNYDNDLTCGTSNYNREATIELGKMFVDTGIVLNIWYNDPEVNNAVMEYAKQTGKSPKLFDSPKNSPSVPGMRNQPGHANHFHLDIFIDPTLTFWEPNC